MKYLKDVYIDKMLKPIQKKILEDLHQGKTEPAFQIIVMSSLPEDLLEIYPGYWFVQHFLKEMDLTVVGIAATKKSAQKMVGTIVAEVYEKTGGTDVTAYLRNTREVIELP